MPAYSFGGINFGPRVGDDVPMVTPGELQQAVRHIPYSDYNVLDLGGKLDRRYAATIRIAPADVAAFEALLGQSRPIVICDVSYPAATLTKLGNHRRTPLPPPAEWHFYDAEWSLVDNVLGALGP